MGLCNYTVIFKIFLTISVDPRMWYREKGALCTLMGRGCRAGSTRQRKEGFSSKDRGHEIMLPGKWQTARGFPQILGI